MEDTISPELNELSRIIRNYAETLTSEEQQVELRASADRLLGLAITLEGLAEAGESKTPSTGSNRRGEIAA